jgi:hypothetical protein
VTGLLRWDKPPAARPREEHERLYGGDGAPPGAYVPNMSEADMHDWKAKMCGQRSEGLAELRVEIRKTIGGGGPGGGTGSGAVQVKMVVYSGDVLVSMNGTAAFTPSEFRDMQRARDEAHEALAAERAWLLRRGASA